tara:strand:+ start:975 stop:1553 length:579 start_codon:yes stop_codon:yes gene_type:complete
MQALMVMYVPTYRKSVITDGWYALRGFTKVTACVHSNDPFAVVWRSLDAIQHNHAVRFEAGDKTTYLTLADKDTTTPRNIFNVRQQNLIRGQPAQDGNFKVQFESSIVFVDRGYLYTLPVPDYEVVFPTWLSAAQLPTHIAKLAHLMQSAYQRLKHNVQFVDLQDKEVVGCQRMENGVVGCKRKRNACVQSV